MDDNDILPVIVQDGLKITPDDAIRILLSFIDEVRRKQVMLESRLGEMALEHNRLVTAVERLATIQGLEYSQDIKDWVFATKLRELKENPR